MWTLSEGHQRKREISRYAFSFFHQRGTYFFFFIVIVYIFYFLIFLLFFIFCVFLGGSAADNVIAVHFIFIIRFSFLIDE